MLRIHFTGEDLRRIELAPGPDALWEVLLSLHRLRRPEGQAVFGAWKRDVRPRVPASAHMLTDLAPSTGYSADFLTPANQTGTLEDALEALRRTPRSRLQADMTELATRHPGRPTPGWTRLLAEGRDDALDHLANAATDYFTSCLQHCWPRVQAQVDGDLAQRRKAHAEGGWPNVLTGLHPSARWSFPVLELDYPAHHDIVLDGRGLILQPAFFCWGAPVTMLDPALPPVLTYPIPHRYEQAAPHEASRGRALAALLGRTRAQVLQVIAVGACSTGQLAGRADLPLPTASQQAAILRDAGLITSERRGRNVLHTITALGAALVHGEMSEPTTRPL
ncbi:ArsR/SmtB family transcription factor [Spirillospora sp. CA-128828]|uniref:ArsR/SmtB family transcription factor n=1 Tax=Spirillospora sp. CA-128828 TaxID=3240033 RepID=UPI003D8ABCE9